MQRSNALKSLLSAATAIGLALAASPALASDSETVAAPAAVAPASSEWGSFGIQTKWMDTSVKPGDDFEAYVNGLYTKTVEIPADKTRIGTFITLRDLSDERVKGILEELARGSYPANSDEARLAASYKAFMDTDAINASGLMPVRPYLQRIREATTPAALADLFIAPGYPSPIDVQAFGDLKNSDVNALYVSAGGLGLPDRDYYLVDTPTFAEARTKYREYLTFILGRAGYQDAPAAADAVFALETEMARLQWDVALQRQRELIYNKVPASELARYGNEGLIARMVEGMGAKADYVIVLDIPPTAAELKAAGLSPEKVKGKIGDGTEAMAALIEKAPVATWQAWMAAHFLSNHAEVLPSDIDDATFAFYDRVLRGQQEQRPRWMRAVDAVESQFGDLLGKLYADRYYPAAERAAMADMIANLRTAMRANLAELSWMGPETRKQALAKLDMFVPKIGMPDKFKTYDGLAVSADDPLGNEIAATKWALDYAMNKVGKPVDRSEWNTQPQVVNAFYTPTTNSITFPAAILQPPFFNLTADPAVNYGAIGAVIGHEIGHGFDDQGSKVDGRGNMRDWWTAADKANFVALQKKLGAQFATYCPYDDGKTCVNPSLTMGENVGDLGGLSLAYRAYKLSLGGKEAPVIDGFTGDQRFFMAYAQNWRGKLREKQEREFIATDPHSPPKYRTNGIVRNFDEWYAAFDVQPGDDLYLPPSERVRIW